MSGEVNVYVVYNASMNSISCQVIAAAIRSSHPTWLVEENELSSFAAGLYDWAPVRVFSNTHESVQDEVKGNRSGGDQNR
jgi:hypothetical protein